jgi:hypothetical protein
MPCHAISMWHSVLGASYRTAATLPAASEDWPNEIWQGQYRKSWMPAFFFPNKIRAAKRNAEINHQKIGNPAMAK